MGGFKEGNEMGKSLYEKVFDRHVVRPLAGGAYQLFIGLHLVHEVTSPQAFQALRDRGLAVRHPERTFATQDHANPTTSLMRPYADGENETQVQTLERNVEHFGIRYFSPERGEHGIVHVVGPELGLTQPGMTIACGDSHTRRMARSAPSPLASAHRRSATCWPPRPWSWTNSRCAVSRSTAPCVPGSTPRTWRSTYPGHGSESRCGLCPRIRGGGGRPLFNGGARDALQHGHRGGSALRLCQS